MTCPRTGKIIYATRQQANAAVGNVKRRRKHRGLEAFYCEACKGHHLGRTLKRIERRPRPGHDEDEQWAA